MPTEVVHGPTSVGLFAGVGGIELGLARAGFEPRLLCEIDPGARAVLKEKFPGVDLAEDIRELAAISAVDVLAAGFPCQDLSQAGRTVGIAGENSGLVDHVFRLIDGVAPLWVVLENVPFMLQLEGGRAMDHLTSELARRGYDWAYRIVDARSFGIPQRRRRVLVVASRERDPRTVLFADDGGARSFLRTDRSACGFYWTEGLRGLGWAVNAVPTLKGGSTIGIPSPPAILMPDFSLVTPDVRDAERLQGFAPDWTLAAASVGQRRDAHRWKLVGNAVCVEMSAWIGRRLREPLPYDEGLDLPNQRELGAAWPAAAYSVQDIRRSVAVSEWPGTARFVPLTDYLQHACNPLSIRAAAGFLSRIRRAARPLPDGLKAAVETHVSRN